MKITIGANDICKTCQFKNPLICMITGIPPTEEECPAMQDDIFCDDTKNISDCKCYKTKKKVKAKKSVNPLVAEIVEYLNLKADKNYRATTGTTVEFINGRLREGYTFEDFKKVIDIKVSEWKGDPKMEQYLCPQTLFRPGNFEKYINQREIKPKDKLQSNPDRNYDIGDIVGGIDHITGIYVSRQITKKIVKRNYDGNYEITYEEGISI